MGTTYVFFAVLLVDWLVGFAMGGFAYAAWSGRSRARQCRSTGANPEVASRRADLARQCESLQSEFRRDLSIHATALNQFERWLQSVSAGSDRPISEVWAAQIASMRKANRRVIKSLEHSAARMADLVRSHGDLPADQRRHLDAYRGKTEALDQSLVAAENQPVTDERVRELAATIDDLQQENAQLQAQLAGCQEELVKQVEATDAAMSTVRMDVLTQLPNRRAFEEKVTELQSSFERQGKDYVVALLDVDGFHQINEKHGQAVGDAVLAMLGRVFRKAQRVGHHLFRYDGEEFALLLVDTELEKARKIVEQYREKVEAASLRSTGQQIGVTVSCGVAPATAEESRRGAVIHADAALKAAKAAGGNQTSVHNA